MGWNSCVGIPVIGFRVWINGLEFLALHSYVWIRGSGFQSFDSLVSMHGLGCIGFGCGLLVEFL